MIDDDGTPDWIPDPVLDADQADIDGAVERLLTQAPTGRRREKAMSHNRVALYARVSTSKCEKCGRRQSDHEAADHEYRGQDSEVQLRELREYETPRMAPTLCTGLLPCS